LLYFFLLSDITFNAFSSFNFILILQKAGNLVHTVTKFLYLYIKWYSSRSILQHRHPKQDNGKSWYCCQYFILPTKGL